jgi:hypothetical protein
MNLDDYRSRNDQAATLAAVLVAGLGCAGALLPVVEHAISLALLAAAGIVVLAVALRTAIRLARERREDAADLLAGAAWRAEHMPHLLIPAPLARERVPETAGQVVA